MADLELAEPSELRDTAAINMYRVMTEQLGVAPREALRAAAAATRDRCRSPLQWSGAPNTGFCPPDARPWLPVNPNYALGVNVAAQQGDSSSLLTFYQRLLGLRRATPALIAGDYQELHQHSEAYLAFLRRDAGAGQTCLVVLNFSHEQQAAVFDFGGRWAQLLFSSAARDRGPLALDWLTLAPFEIVIAELD